MVEEIRYKYKEFIFYLMPEFTLLAFSSAVEALRLANYIVGYELYRWRTVSLDGDKVKSSCGIALDCTSSLSNEVRLTGYADETFMAVICGGMNIERHYNKQIGVWLRKCRQNNVAVASLCTGAHVLAKADLLIDKKCVIHWENIPSFMEQFSNASVQARLFEVDSSVHTCAGGMAAFDMLLHFIRQDCDDSVVARICEQAIVDKVRNIDDKQRLPFSSASLRHHPTVTKLIEKMQETISEPVPVDRLMLDLGLTRRQIERHFRTEMKISPARYYMRLRLERARLLLQHMDMPIIEIAIASGFSSASHFSKSYREVYGCSPHEARKTKQTIIATRS
ncbi:GlxA family transcriptional regulator [Bartonella sp. LJL80]